MINIYIYLINIHLLHFSKFHQGMGFICLGYCFSLAHRIAKGLD